MKLYLISNNLLLDGLDYSNKANLDLIRLIRPLSTSGEDNAKKIANLEVLSNVDKIFTSFHSSALDTSKYLARKLELEMSLNELLNDCKVGVLGSKNMKMVKGLQDHEFTYKLANGESLIDVGNRINDFIMNMDYYKNVAIFTHKRAILGFLLKYAKIGYNLDDNLILEYNDNIIYDDSESEYDIYEIIIEDHNLTNIKRIN